MDFNTEITDTELLEKRQIISAVLNEKEVLTVENIPSEYSQLYDLIKENTSISVSFRSTQSLSEEVSELSFLGDSGIYFSASLGDSSKFCKDNNIFSPSSKVICDSLMSTILEHESKKYINDMYGSEYALFCPGYNGTSTLLNKSIISNLDWRTSVKVHSSGALYPDKSMCGVLVKNYKFSCKGCALLKNCKYLRDKKTCY